MEKNKSKKTVIFLLGAVLTFIGILLPWLDTIFIPIHGVFTWGGFIVSVLLATSICFYFVFSNEKLVSVILVISSIISISIVMSASELISDPFVRLAIGAYVTVVGSVFIVIAGIIGLLQPEKNRPFEDH